MHYDVIKSGEKEPKSVDISAQNVTIEHGYTDGDAAAIQRLKEGESVRVSNGDTITRPVGET